MARLAVVTLPLLLLAAGQVAAQQYPAKPLRWISPYFLGGRLQFFFGVPVSTLPHMKTGRMRALAMPELRERLRQDGAETVGNSGEALAAMVRDDVQRWRKVVREAGIKVEQ